MEKVVVPKTPTDLNDEPVLLFQNESGSPEFNMNTSFEIKNETVPEIPNAFHEGLNVVVNAES